MCPTLNANFLQGNNSKKQHVQIISFYYGNLDKVDNLDKIGDRNRVSLRSTFMCDYFYFNYGCLKY